MTPAPVRIEDAVLEPLPGGTSHAFEEGSVTEVVTGSAEGCEALLEAILGMRAPDRGRILLLGEDPGDLPRRKLYDLRSRVGVYHRGGGLISNLKVVENVALPLLYHTSMSTDEVAEIAFASLGRAGYAGSPFELPGRLSVFRRAAAGLARVFAADPEVAIYDRLGSDLDEREREPLHRAALDFHRERPGRATIFLFSHPGILRGGEPATALDLSGGRFR